jgi:hypothetical protein
MVCFSEMDSTGTEYGYQVSASPPPPTHTPLLLLV